MPLDEATLSARDAQRNIGLELLEAVRQVKAGNVGNQQQIATDTVLTLSAAETRHFLAALDAPFVPNARLQAAMDASAQITAGQCQMAPSGAATGSG